MSANVGLSTPRGSGTSGYVTKNHAHLRPRDQTQYAKEPDFLKHNQRQPDKQILDHEKAREIEVKVFDLRDQLEEEGLDEEEIEARCEALRKKLSTERPGASTTGRGLKKHQVHEMAAAKIEESDRLRRALGISRDYEEGSHWRKQEERLRESVQGPDSAETRETGASPKRIAREDDRVSNDRRRYDSDRRDRRRDDDDDDDDDRPRTREHRRRPSDDYSDGDNRRRSDVRRSPAARYRSRSRSPR